jgi:dTDP-4-amino-4,6-dideoxygalactose transaminase
LHKFYSERLGVRRGDFPNAERISDRTVSLPLSPKMTDGDVTFVIENVRAVLGG